VLEQGIQSLSAAERDVFVPLWEQLDEATQLFVLNGFTNAPLMSCTLTECKLRIQ